MEKMLKKKNNRLPPRPKMSSIVEPEEIENELGLQLKEQMSCFLKCTSDFINNENDSKFLDKYLDESKKIVNHMHYKFSMKISLN